MRCAPLYLCTILVMCAAPARAGNLHSFFMGNHAALSAGAVTAITHDGAALWYNPAGLAGAGIGEAVHRGQSRDTVDVSGSAFMLRFRSFPDVIQSDLPVGRTTRSLDSVDFLSVPTSLAYVRQVHPDVSIAFGVFVPRMDSFEIDDAFDQTNVHATGEPLDFSQRVVLQQNYTEYHLGFGFGWKINDRLRVGATLFLTYATLARTTQFWSHVRTSQSNSRDESLFLDSFVDEQSFGGYLAAGVQWEPRDGWRMGFTLKTPAVLFGTISDGHQIESSYDVQVNGSSVNAATFAGFAPSSNTSFPVQMTAPLQLGFGVSWTWDEGWLSVDMDVTMPMRNGALGIDWDFNYNVRVGGRFRLADMWYGGAGGFTDLSPEKAPRDLGEFRTDYVGCTFGVERRTVLRVADKPDDEPLVMSTFIGFRYAVGFGEIGGIRYDPLVSTGATAIGIERDSIFHEVSVHLGSGFYF